MKREITRLFKITKRRNKLTKRKMLNLSITSGLILASLATPISIAITSDTINASAAALDIELLSNITSKNDSGTSTNDRWTESNQNQPVNFSISGSALSNVSAGFSGKKQAVLVIPSELRGHVATAGEATINTNVTIDLSKVTVLTSVSNAINDLTNVMGQITSGALGNLTSVNIDLTEVNHQLEIVNNIENAGSAVFKAPETLSTDGTYISAPISDGLGLILAQNISKTLQNLNSAVQKLKATGSGIVSNVVATAINTALLPVKGAVNVAVSGALSSLAIGGAGVNELVNASLLGTTTVTLPTTVSTPQNLTKNLDAHFVGTVIQTNLIDINLLSTANGVSDIYFEKNNQAQEAVNNLFGDKEHTQLAEGVTQEDIDAAKVLVDKVTDEAKKQELLNGIQKAQDLLNDSTKLTLDELTAASKMITGTAEPNSQLRISINGVAKTVIKADKDGHYSWRTSKLSVGNVVRVEMRNLETNKFDKVVEQNITKSGFPDEKITLNPVISSNDTVITGTTINSEQRLLISLNGKAKTVITSKDGVFEYRMGKLKLNDVVKIEALYDSVVIDTVEEVVKANSDEGNLNVRLDEITSGPKTIITGLASTNATLRISLNEKAKTVVTADEEGKFSYMIGKTNVGDKVKIEIRNDGTFVYATEMNVLK